MFYIDAITYIKRINKPDRKKINNILMNFINQFT
nr:MAG TPA: hypothetical protein [Caudoviricetes sp.]DAR39252.1 MAG TPA: hypothetical protein [Caudoviricetes sp.]DAX30826.1 MAG TPA: hypothetical protein [Caudoviricetes sp.]